MWKAGQNTSSTHFNDAYKCCQTLLDNDFNSNTFSKSGAIYTHTDTRVHFMFCSVYNSMPFKGWDTYNIQAQSVDNKYEEHWKATGRIQ